MSAVGKRPEDAVEWCQECLERQSILGDYDTSLLALVLFAAHAPRGLLASILGIGVPA